MGKTAEYTFKKADLNKNGFIEKAEIKGLIEALIKGSNLHDFLSPPTEAQAAYHLQAADTDGDGKVSLTEWKAFIKDFIVSRLVSAFAFLLSSFGPRCRM